MLDSISHPSWINLPYGKKAEAYALGENGTVQCHGVSLSIIRSDLLIEPVNSKGNVSRARIPVPLTSLPELRDALDAMMAHPTVLAAIGFPPDHEAPERPATGASELTRIGLLQRAASVVAAARQIDDALPHGAAATKAYIDLLAALQPLLDLFPRPEDC